MQTLCGSLVQLEGLISVQSTILTQQQNSECPRSPWISLHKFSGLNFSCIFIHRFLIFLLGINILLTQGAQWLVPKRSCKNQRESLQSHVRSLRVDRSRLSPRFWCATIVSYEGFHASMTSQIIQTISIDFYRVCKVLTGCL